ncbi:MAG: CDP-glycerol glycerophosphotransferase family protein [Candidatus Omnitrophica bacterium]|nr:CDP-glycerol glycerophosphotransferase family protein [Candidatus Omnitrophota bacterium]
MKGFIGWGLIIPLNFLIPKKKNRVIVIGRDKGSFSGNAKYLYLYITEHHKADVEVYFLTGLGSVAADLKKAGLPVLFCRSWRAVWKQLRAKMIVVDGHEWVQNRGYHFCFFAEKIQLWHGASPMKQGEWENANEMQRRSALLERISDFLLGRFPDYSMVVINHERFISDYQKMFRTQKVYALGCPQLDFFFGGQIAPEKLNLQTDLELITRIRGLKRQGMRIIMYAPTFRDNTTLSSLSDGALQFDELNEFLKRNNLFFCINCHPYVQHSRDGENLSNILMDHPGLDVLPLLKEADLLITDYSSIFYEYLFWDRPVIFFPYDYERYVARDRILVDGYFERTPGPKCRTQKELIEEIDHMLIQGRDEYSARRKEEVEKVFQFRDGKCCERIFNRLTQ